MDERVRLHPQAVLVLILVFAIDNSSIPRTRTRKRTKCVQRFGNRRAFVILNHAHRQIHAENAGSPAGGAGLRVATEQFRNYERTLSFCSSGPKRWNSSPAPREDRGKC